MDESNKSTVSNKFSLETVKRWYRSLPDKKRYLEFITAFLTIPVLLTVLLNNVNNFQRQQPISPTPTILPTPKLFQPSPTQSPVPTPTVQSECKKEVGPIEILYPEEKTIVSDNPLCLDISKQGTQYCSVVWSYRMNGSPWSNYTDKTICMYGLDPGLKNLELRIKSIASGDEIILKRIFTIFGNPSPTPASASAIIQK